VILGISSDVTFLEMREGERHAGDVTDSAGASGDVLESAPPVGEHGDLLFAVVRREQMKTRCVSVRMSSIKP
jgi:hypothetical protein